MNKYEEVELLLVEDSEEDAELTLRALRQRNLVNQVHHVQDGADALDFLFARGKYSHRDINHHPKVVLLDLKLPKVDGLQVLTALRADERTRSLPIVMMTSSKEDRDLERAYELGVNSYVVKPVDFDQFAKAVDALGMYWTLVNESHRP